LVSPVYNINYRIKVFGNGSLLLVSDKCAFYAECDEDTFQFCLWTSKTIDMKNDIIASESFSSAGKYYFLDFKIARNNSNYIRITRSDSKPDGTYERSSLSVWEEDLPIFIACLSSLFITVEYVGKPEETVQDMYQNKQEKRDKGIKSWAPEMRPREKMLEQGPTLMKSAELLAMLIGSGTPNETAVSLAGKILDSVGGDLLALSKLDIKSLCRFSGMGIAKASSVMAAMELAKRMYPMLNVKPVKTMRIASGAYLPSHGN
jgi:DNA repair protein RadC